MFDVQFWNNSNVTAWFSSITKTALTNQNIKKNQDEMENMTVGKLVTNWTSPVVFSALYRRLTAKHTHHSVLWKPSSR